MHAAETLRWAGATPLLTAFSRPKFSGVAPARHAGSATVFCPRGVGSSSGFVRQFVIQNRKEE
jgi:hypothetical protein